MKRKKMIMICLVTGLLLISVTPYVNADVADIQLPTIAVTMNLIHNYPTSYFLVTLSGVPDGFDVKNDAYIGWCADPDTFIDISVSHQVMLYSSYGTLPSHLQNPNWSKVNYIINHKQGNPISWNYYLEIQFAIWYVLGYGDRGMEKIGQPMNAIAWAMVDDANTNGSGYIPLPGEVLAIIADSGPDTQGIFFEITITENYEGLTPGFWKNHINAWETYSPEQTLNSVFSSLAGSNSLSAALRFKGGHGLSGATRILLRAAVAALLNAAHPDINYPLTEEEIISQVNNALGGKRDDMLDLACELDTYNNLEGVEL